MILVLTGATGTGKSKMAISLAKKLGAAVINADAFQVYQELGIATAKPTHEMMMEVPHYLFDFIPLTSDYSVFEYQKDLRSCLYELEKRGVPAIIAGGTGLYIRAGLMDYEFSEEKPVDLSEYEGLSNEELHKKLEDVDEISASEIHPNNRRRVLRALEVYLATGKRKSDFKSEGGPKILYDAKFFGLKKERDSLYPIVEQRVEDMFEMGLLDEVKTLTVKYGREVGAFQAIGVKELFPYLDGEKSLEECKAEIKKATRNYIKRQETFFRHQFEITWIENEEEILSEIKNG